MRGVAVSPPAWQTTHQYEKDLRGNGYQLTFLLTQRLRSGS